MSILLFLYTYQGVYNIFVAIAYASMGIPGLIKELGPPSRVALSKLAIEHLEKTNRPLRIAIDAAIWNFQTQSAKGGRNPELRTLFFRLLKLLALPIHPVFVYDGKNKPLTKRGKTVSRYGTCVPNEMSKALVARFQFPHHTAPGEAEAECALLQRKGVVDAVMSQDVDAIMFGSTVTYRDWSKEGTKGNKTPTHVSLYSAEEIQRQCKLDRDGMVLVAMLSGGDYSEGVPGFGMKLAVEAARVGFGGDLLRLVEARDELGLREWRERLEYELHTNESGYFARRHKTVSVPEDFPDRNILGYYMNPAVSSEDKLPELERRWSKWWNTEIDVRMLRDYTATTFDWMYKGGARRFIRCFAQPLFQSQLRKSQIDEALYSVDNVSEQRQHFVNDGIPELRLSTVPLDVVGIDLAQEEENPEFAELDTENEEDEAGAQETIAEDGPSSPSKRRSRPPWDPSVAEKWWIPETLVQLGLPVVVEDWRQKQRDIAADPIKFATRKCPKPKAKSKGLDSTMKNGALSGFVTVSKSTKTTRTKVTGDATADVVPSLNGSTSRPIEHFFKTSKKASSMKVERAFDEIDLPPIIDLCSSPVKPIEIIKGVITERQNFQLSSLETITHDEEDVPLPPSVTRRRRKRNPASRTGEHASASSTSPTRRRSSWRRSGPNEDISAKPKVPELVINSAQPTLQNVKIKALKAQAGRLAMSRESLPGSWKDVIAFDATKPRISIVDMTSD